MSGLLKYLAILLLPVIATQYAYGQGYPDLRFEHITTHEGLTTNNTTAVTQDKQGFIWIGTLNGLNRYDGYRMKHYFHDDTDSNSIVGNTIQTMQCDSKGRLWIATDEGVSCYFPQQNRFVNYSSAHAMPFHLINNSSVRVYESALQEIWLLNQPGVMYRVLDDMSLQSVPTYAAATQSQKRINFTNLFRDSSGMEWAYYKNRVYRLNSARQAVQTFSFGDTAREILGILEEHAGVYKLATWANGIMELKPGANNIRQIKECPEGVYMAMTHWRCRDKELLVMAEASMGIFMQDRTTGMIKQFKNEPRNQASLQGTSFRNVFADNKNNLWICSNQGVEKVTTSGKAVEVIPVTDPGTVDYDVYKSGVVFSFFENDSMVWLSKRNRSTLSYNTNMQMRSCYSSLYPLSTVVQDRIMHAYYFYQQQRNLYITTDSGLIIYNLPQKRTSLYYPDQYTNVADLRTIVPLGQDKLLIRSFSSGLMVFDTKQKRFVRHYTATDSCTSCFPRHLTYILKTRNNKIYVTSAKGLFQYLPAQDRFEQIQPVNDKYYHTCASNMFGMAEASDGRLWIAGSYGLYVYNPVTNVIDEFHSEHGKMGSLFRVCFDNSNNVWAVGVAGVWCYLNQYHKWINFNNQDGLPGSDFEGIVALRRNGDIIAGLEGAIAIFHPALLAPETDSIPVVITEAVVDNNEQRFSLYNDAPKKLVIPPGQTIFSIDFSILSYNNVSALQYYYQLEPSMKEYQLNNNGHLNFNGLPPGRYKLHVKGGNKSGTIFNTEDILEITVQPHWYQTTWFKLAMVLLLIIVVVLFARRRIAGIRKEAVFRQKIAETEMQALRAQMNPHFIFNSLNSIENFIMQNEKRLASDYLNKFARLIRMILNSSRHELVPLSKDMEAMQLYIDLEQLRFNHTFTYQTIIDPVLLDGDYRVPPLLIQPYVENAIVHGLAHSDRKDLRLLVTASLQHDYIHYSIQDNGIGRQKAAVYNQQNKPHHASVGLTITEERIGIFNAQQHGNGKVVITDLYNEQGNAAGTKVDITIKAV